MKRLVNTKVNRISQWEKEIELITEELMDKNNFVKNKYAAEANSAAYKKKEDDKDGNWFPYEQL